jgi:signal transduction histidine kinase
VSTWAAAIGAALLVSLVVAVRNYFAYRVRGAPMPFWIVFVGEIPLWLVWACLFPAIVALARRFPPLGPHALRNGSLHVVVGLVISFVGLLCMIVVRTWLPVHGEPELTDPEFWGFLWTTYLGVCLAFLFIYGTAVGLALAWTYYRDEQERRTREARLEATLSRTERDLLRMQIHPHFLFNTLNAISALVEDAPHDARRMIVRLSDLLRLSREEDARHEVTLDEELDFLARYVEIQKIRFGERLAVEEHVDAEARTRLLPRLLLQPLVENAIQHGIARKEEGGTVSISAVLRGDALVVEVADDGPGPDGGGRGGTGMGLRNGAARLRQLYGSAAGLTLEAREGGGAVVRVVIPSHGAPVSGEPGRDRGAGRPLVREALAGERGGGR